jgi:membrane protein
MDVQWSDFTRYMQQLRTGWRRLRERLVPLDIAVQAIQSYIRHQSANQAGSVAFSTVLSLFPFVLFLSAAAAFVGEPGAAADLVRRVVRFAPPLVVDALKPVIDEVMGQRNRALVTVGIFFTVWTASSGMQAVRTALNKAYGVTQGLSFWRARIKVTLFTVFGTVALLLAFSSVVVLPNSADLLERALGISTNAFWLRDGLRVVVAFGVLTALYAALYGWLPDLRQQVRSVLPGAVVGALMWLIAAWLLSYSLRGAGNLALIYGGFAGVVATLVFLYASAVTLIFGGEVNAVLLARHRSA